MSSPSPANHRARPEKTAASPTRSSVESSQAPQRLVLSVIRAIVPSMRSEKTNAVMNTVPQKNSPRGKNASAPTTTPTVPTRVTTSGLTPRRTRKPATGRKMRVKRARAKRLSM
jgi:hypothetical protein